MKEYERYTRLFKKNFSQYLPLTLKKIMEKMDGRFMIQLQNINVRYLLETFLIYTLLKQYLIYWDLKWLG